jgi:hypothetical protein
LHQKRRNKKKNSTLGKSLIDKAEVFRIILLFQGRLKYPSRCRPSAVWIFSCKNFGSQGLTNSIFLLPEAEFLCTNRWYGMWFVFFVTASLSIGAVLAMASAE